MHRPARLLLLALLACAVTGCASNRGVLDPDFDFAGITSYAWRDAPSYAGGSTDHPGELADFERRVQRVLEERGVQLVAKSDAQVLLTGVLSVVRRVEQSDPNFTNWTTTEYEVGTMTIEVYDRQRRKRVWSDELSRRLRDTARAFGGRLGNPMVETGERRDWRIYDMVDELLARLPK